MTRNNRRFKAKRGRIAAVTAAQFSADELAAATQPFEQKGFAVSVVSNKPGMLVGRTEKGQDVNLVPASTVGDMEFDDYCALILSGNSHSISESAQAAVEKFLADGKPVIAMADDVSVLAEAMKGADIHDAPAALTMNGRVFAANSNESADQAMEVFAKAIAA